MLTLLSTRKLLILAIAGTIAGAIVAVRVLEPQVDHLAMAFLDATTPEAVEFLDRWWLLIDVSDRLATLAFGLILMTGIPLTGLAMFAKHRPDDVPTLAQNVTAARLCLTLQAIHLGLSVVLSAVLAVFDEMTLTVATIAVVYFIANFAAVRVWRDVLLRLDTPNSRSIEIPMTR